MGSGKQNARLSERVENCDFDKLRDSQVWTLSDWMRCRHVLRGFKKTSERRARLREICLANLQHAQAGYDIIVLGKQPTGAAPLNTDVEKRMYEVLTNIVTEHSAALGEEAFKLAGEAVDALKPSLMQAAKDAVAEVAKRTAPIVIKRDNKVKKVEGVLPPEFKRMVQLASARIPILLVGPAGCGKTYLSEKLAEALDLECSDQSCSEGMSESVFNGRLLPIGKHGEFEHVPSPFMERYEKGGVMLLDELDAGDPNLFTYINKAIANSSYTAEQRWKKPVVKKHEDFVLIAAANTYGNGADAMYVGRNQLDAATLDRFKVGLVTMDYNRDVESALAPQELCEWAWGIRDRIQTNKLRRIMSTRVIADLAKVTRQHGWNVNDWNAAYFAGWTEAERKLVTVQ